MCVKMTGLEVTQAASWMTEASAGRSEREIAACELTVPLPVSSVLLATVQSDTALINSAACRLIKLCAELGVSQVIPWHTGVVSLCL